MKKIYFLIILALNFSLYSYSQCDSMNRYNEKEIIKLSNQIYELEKKDSLAKATEPNGFGLKDKTTITDPKLLVDLMSCDSMHSYTDKEVLALSNYLYALEKQDSINKVMEEKKALAVAEAAKKSAKEYHLEEENEIKNFETQVFFATNSASLTDDSYKPLDLIVKILTSYINLNFIVEGYTDNVGSDEYNLFLSKRRAKTIREYFISKGVPASRITAVGYGESKPKGSNETKEGRALNRRVDIKAIH